MPAPNLTSPASGAVDQSITASLTWDAVGGATDYQVQIARESTFADPDFDGLTETTGLDLVDVVGEVGYPLDFGETYYWRVRARADGVPDTWAAARPFTTESVDLPFTPNLDHEGDGLSQLLQQFKGGI